MTRFLARRILNYLVLLTLATFVAYLLVAWWFNPLESLLGRNPRPPQQVIDARAAQLGLNDPLLVRYWDWITGVVTGDFGTTIGGQPVTEELWRRIGVSLRLLVIGSVMGTVLGVVIGAWGAIRQYKLSDRLITLFALLIISTHVLVLAATLQMGAREVNALVGFNLINYIGETSVDAGAGLGDQLVDRAVHLVLPTMVLALSAMAGYSRYQRNAMLDILNQDFIRTARAKGLTRRQALFKHGLRTALIPMAVMFAYGVSGVVTGAVFVEKIFGWHGMGEWVVLAISTQDVNVVAAYGLFSGVVILIGGLLSDIVLAALDPRVRVS